MTVSSAAVVLMPILWCIILSCAHSQKEEECTLDARFISTEFSVRFHSVTSVSLTCCMTCCKVLCIFSIRCLDLFWARTTIRSLWHLLVAYMLIRTLKALLRIICWSGAAIMQFSPHYSCGAFKFYWGSKAQRCSKKKCGLFVECHSCIADKPTPGARLAGETLLELLLNTPIQWC